MTLTTFKNRVRKIVPRPIASGARVLLHSLQKNACFLVLFCFLASFAWIRLSALYLSKHYPQLNYQNQFQWGTHAVVFGHHVHHMFLGVLLLAIAGWMGIQSTSQKIKQLALIFYGIGLGLAVDEVGFTVEGITPYHNDLPFVMGLVALIGSLLLLGGFSSRIRKGWHNRQQETPPPSDRSTKIPTEPRAVMEFSRQTSNVSPSFVDWERAPPPRQ